MAVYGICLGELGIPTLRVMYRRLTVYDESNNPIPCEWDQFDGNTFIANGIQSHHAVLSDPWDDLIESETQAPLEQEIRLSTCEDTYEACRLAFEVPEIASTRSRHVENDVVVYGVKHSSRAGKLTPLPFETSFKLEALRIRWIAQSRIAADSQLVVGTEYY